VTFVNGTPIFRISAVENPAKFVLAQFQKIEEIQGDLVVRTIYFPAEGYQVTTNSSDVKFVITILGTTFQLEFLMLQDITKFYFGNYQYESRANSLKGFIELHRWPFANAGNTLQLVMSFEYSDANIVTTLLKNSSGLQSFQLQANGFTIFCDILRIAEVDGVFQPIDAQWENGTKFIRFYFPYFSSSLIYDPNFSVLLGDDNQESSGSGGGGPNVGVAVGVTFGVAIAVIIVVVIIILLLQNKNNIEKGRKRKILSQAMRTTMENRQETDMESRQDIELHSTQE